MQRAGKTAAGDHADGRAHHLHERHQRPGDQRCPQKCKAVLRPGDGVSRDARGIIIRRAREMTPGPGEERKRLRSPGLAFLRLIVGTVESHEGAIVRVKGYLFAMDSTRSQFVRREQLRTRIVSLNDAVIVNILPAHVQIDRISYTHRPNGDILVTNGTDRCLDITHL